MTNAAARIIETTRQHWEKSMFLTKDELVTLTGRKNKSNQIEWLRREAIPFRVNATGHPVVTKAAIEGRTEAPQTDRKWTPRVLAA
jgi:hypothetical protein